MRLLLLIVLALTGCATGPSAENWLAGCLANSSDKQYCHSVYQAQVYRDVAQRQMIQNAAMQMNQPVQQPQQPRRTTCMQTAYGLVQCF